MLFNFLRSWMFWAYVYFYKYPTPTGVGYLARGFLFYKYITPKGVKKQSQSRRDGIFVEININQNNTNPVGMAYLLFK